MTEMQNGNLSTISDHPLATGSQQKKAVLVSPLPKGSRELPGGRENVFSPVFSFLAQKRDLEMSTNKNVRMSRAIQLALGVGMAMAMSAAPAVNAEEEAAELERVQVTGSRLSQVDIEGAAPVTSVSREDLNRGSYDSVGEFLQSMPAMSGSPLSVFTNNGGTGASTVDLRGLGSDRTLVLINGRRSDSISDLNTMPIALVERIDILKDGASAIYGADAVAGVINIITRSDFEGMELSVQYQDWTQASAPTTKVGGIFGGNNDRGNIVLGFDVVEKEGITQGELDGPEWLSAPFTIIDPDSFRQFGFVRSGPNQNVFQIGSSAPPGGNFIGDFDGDGAFDDDSYTLDYTYGGPGSDPGTGDSRTYADGSNPANYHVMGDGPQDFYNYDPENFLQTPSKRISLFSQGSYEINSSVRAFMEVAFQRRESKQLLAPLPLFTDVGDPGFAFTLGTDSYNGVSADNVYNPFGIDVAVRRRMKETGGRHFTQTRDAYRALAGIDGMIADRWNYEVSYNFSETLRVDTESGQFYGQDLANALGPSFDNDPGAGFSPVCGTDPDGIPDSGDETIVAGCVPMNVFGGPGTVTPEMLEYASVTTNDRIKGRTSVLNASIGGDLFDLPAGWWQGLVGFEQRQETFSSIPDSAKVKDVVTGNTGGPTRGEKSVSSYFVETRIPLLSDMTLASMLDVTAGYRRDSFDAFGSASSYNVGIRWKPIDDLLVRTTIGTSFREPTISDLYAGVSDSFPAASDPCGNDKASGEAVYSELTAAQQTNCHNNGVPVGGWNDSTTAQIRSRVGGNASVEAEEGDSFTFGVAWAPSFVPGFSVMIDYWNFEIEQAINALQTQTVLNGCAFDGLYCDLIERRSNGQILSVTTLTDNISTETARGVDLELKFAHSHSFGDFTHRMILTQLLEREFQESVTTERVDVAGLFDNTYLGDSSFAKTRMMYTTDWSYGNWGASGTLEYIGSMSDENDFNPGIEVPSVLYLDLMGRYHFVTGTSVAFGISNVTDEEPPFINAAFNGTIDEATHRPLGTGYFVRLSQSF